MEKKKLIILAVVVVVALIAIVVFFGGFFKGELGQGKSLMDMASEQGQKVPSKNEAIAECEKPEQQDDKDMCYNMAAFYYRDAGLCKNIKDLETKKWCTKEKIEEYYKSLEAGEGNMPGIPGMPGTSGTSGGENGETGKTEGQGNSGGPTITGEMNDNVYVEIAARVMYITSLISSKYQTDPTAYGEAEKKLEKSFEEFGVTEEEVNAYFDKLSQEGGVKTAELMQRVQQRAAELQATGL